MVLVGVLAATATVDGARAASALSVEDLGRLSIEDLANVEITSVAKRPQALSRAPAAAFVISGEDIRRSGATTLPEALRLAPNLHVTRVDASSYAISARGFNTFQASNKLLVMIDGRSIYTPFHGGVFWDQQQVLLDDVERIEVISGPGGTLWGANAVNGVINVITKKAQQTQGALAVGQVGTVEDRAAMRFGGKLGEAGGWRVYGMTFNQANSVTSAGRNAKDDWDGRQAGFRLDWGEGKNGYTLQGDAFTNAFSAGGSTSGGNVLGRWTRVLGEDSALEVQGYYDKVDRSTPGVTDKLETFDIQAQHSFPLGSRHAIVWGGGYRASNDEFTNRLNPFVVDPKGKTVSIGNVFVQDTIALRDNVALTLGTKLEYSSYSGLEYLPSARVAWQVSETDLLWAAISRAVRTPSRVDRDLTAPFILDRATELKSEELVAYELGYRGHFSQRASLSLSLFYNEYDDLRVLTISPTTGRLVFGNAMQGYTYGVETWGDWRLTDWWRLSGGLTVLKKNLRLEPGAIRVALEQHVGNDPEYQFLLRSSMDLSDSVELDVGLRAVDELPSPGVPHYVAVDARLGWRVTDSLELSITGFNLFDDRHPETGDKATRREVRRSIYAGARWRY